LAHLQGFGSGLRVGLLQGGDAGAGAGGDRLKRVACCDLHHAARGRQPQQLAHLQGFGPDLGVGLLQGGDGGAGAGGDRLQRVARRHPHRARWRWRWRWRCRVCCRRRGDDHGDNRS